ncbi:MAG TPA: GIY-YIG nuclease family protein [Candidatus Saccharimonadales bacterium]|nr:GIY-YIG nuclease family protein [Candidatus Saccharimonadales bacterium]
MHKDDILAEIKRTATENDGKPLGVARFEQVTGIRPYDWGKFWARFSDAQKEADYEPNTLVGSFTDEHLLIRMAALTRELQKYPTNKEMRLKRYSDPDFPNSKVFERFGSKQSLVQKLLAFSQANEEYADIVPILTPLVAPGGDSIDDGSNDAVVDSYGFVYLVKGHPGEYKIGRTNLVDRRLSELGATASIEQTLIHEIKTDDPAGIEAYWHRRFADKRMKGEWFKLTAADVKTFKRWRRIY